jgi:hypothetical protein
MRIRFSLLTLSLSGTESYLSPKLQNYLSAEGNIDEQQRWANQFRWELARHSVSEELILFPALEKYLGAGGKKMADEGRAEHYEVSAFTSPLSLLFRLLTVNRSKVSCICSKHRR